MPQPALRVLRQKVRQALEITLAAWFQLGLGCVEKHATKGDDVAAIGRFGIHRLQRLELRGTYVKF